MNICGTTSVPHAISINSVSDDRKGTPSDSVKDLKPSHSARSKIGHSTK